LSARVATRQIVSQLASLLVLIGLSFSSTTTLAHGEAPELNQLLFHPTEPETMVIVATYGLLITEDAGMSWRWVCAEALFDEYSVVGPGVLDAEGTVTLGSPRGVMRGENLGCNWSRPSEELERLYIVDLQDDPSDPTRAVALSWVEDGISNVFNTSDSGRTWTKQWPPFPARFLSQGIRATLSAPSRIYASGVTLAGTRSLLFRFDGATDSWQEFPVTTDEGTGSFASLVVGIAPDNDDQVYVRSITATHDQVAVSDDGGANFRSLARMEAPALAAGRPFGFAFTPDGAVWAGNKTAGLWRLDGAEARAVRADLAVTHLDVQGSDLYIGLDGFAGDEMAELFRAPGGNTDMLEPVMIYEDLRGVQICSSPEVQAACEPFWEDLQRHVGLLPPLEPDAGVPDSGMSASPGDAAASSQDAGATPIPSESHSEGCHLVPASHEGSTHILGLCFLVAVLVLRRRGSRMR